MRGKRKPPSTFMVYMDFITWMTHCFLGMVGVITVKYSVMFPGSFDLNLHVFLCTFGYVLMMAEAVLALSPHNRWSKHMKSKDKTFVHLVLGVAGSVFAMAGTIIKGKNAESDIKTPHGILGIIAMLFTVISFIGGLVCYLTTKTTDKKIKHAIAGSVTLVASFLSLCLGLNYESFRNFTGNSTANIAIVLTLLGLVGSLCHSSMITCKRIKKRRQLLQETSLLQKEKTEPL